METIPGSPPSPRSCFCSGLSSPPAPPNLISPPLTQETVDTLRAFVRVDTSSPPGNETRGAEFLKAILDKAGIPCELVGANPARLNLVARLKGSGKKRPIVLMGHTDVVGVERDKWTVDPFEGVIKDDFLYGRGSSDDKCMTTVSASR